MLRAPARHPHMFDLARFKTAQDDPNAGFDVALRELRAGRKRSHWIWYIFPQLAGLGSSSMAVAYGVRGLDEAHEYLRDPLLADRLVAVAAALAAHLTGPHPSRVDDVMGSAIDARKVVSSMTLFREAARRRRAVDPSAAVAALEAAAEVILTAAAAQGLPACAFTTAALTS